MADPLDDALSYCGTVLARGTVDNTHTDQNKATRCTVSYAKAAAGVTISNAEANDIVHTNRDLLSVARLHQLHESGDRPVDAVGDPRDGGQGVPSRGGQSVRPDLEKPVRTRQLLSCLLALIVAFVMSSCTTAPPPVQAAKALEATAVSVDTAMKVAGSLYRAGAITEAQKAETIRAYSKYQNAARIAYAGIRAWNNQADGKPVSLDDVRRAADALVALIDSFSKKGAK